MGAENLRGGGPVRGEQMQELLRYRARVRMMAKLQLLRKRDLVQPVEQRIADAAQSANLRVVNMRIDKTGQQHAAAQVSLGCIGVLGADLHIIPAGGDSAALHQQRAVLNRNKGMGFAERVARRMKDG